MVLARTRSWFISPDWQKCEIDAGKSAPDLGEVWAVAGIACEIDDSPSYLDDEPAPKAMVEIVDAA